MKTPHILTLGLVSFFLTAAAARAVTETWDGGGGNDNLSTGLNWADDTAPASSLANTDLIFAGVVRDTPNVSVALSVHSITFDNTATAFNIVGTTLSVGTGGITNDDTQLQAFNNLISFSSVANSVINAVAGPLRFINAVGLPQGTLTLTGGFDTEFNVFSFPSAILKQGAGTMTWRPGSGGQQDVTVSAGTLRMGENGVLGHQISGPGSLAINGTSVLRIDEHLKLNGAPLTRASGADINLAAGKTLEILNGDATITGGFTNNTASTIVIRFDATLTTTTTLGFDGGTTVQISANGDVSAGTTLRIGTSGDGTVTVDGSGSSLGAGSTMSVGLSGATGNLTFTNASTGGFNTIAVDASGVGGTDGTLEILSGSVVTGTGLSIAPNAAPNMGQVRIADAGSMLTLTSTATIGATSASAGTLNIQAGGIFRSGTGTTTVNPTGTISITGGTCSAAGNLTLNGGTLSRDGSGVLAVDAGKTFTVQNGGSAALTGFTIFNGFNSTVTGASSVLKTVTGSFSFQNGATLNVAAGGQVDAQALSLNFGNGAGALVTATIDGAGSGISGATGAFWGSLGGTADVTFSNDAAGSFPGGMQIAHTTGAGSSADVTVESGADITSGNLALAGQVGAGVIGTITVTGAGSSWVQNSTSALTIGAASASSGTLNVDSGSAFTTGTGLTTVNATGAIAIAGGTCSAAGNLTLNGGQLTRDAAGAFLIGPTRTFTVQAGGDAAFTGTYTGSVAQNITVTGAGSTLTTLGGGALQIRGDAALSVLAGGAVASAGPLNVGTGVGGGDGTITVNSAASNLSVVGLATLGFNGNTGAITFLNGSTGTFAGLNVGVSAAAGTHGQLSIQSGSAVTATGLGIGSGSAVNTGAANLSGAGSSLTILGTGATTIGAAANTVGSLTIQSGAIFSSGTGLTTVNATGTISIVGTYQSRGDLTLNGGSLSRLSPISAVFALDPGTTFRVQNGGTATFNGTYVHNTASNIVVTGAGSTLTTTGGGALQIRGGAALSVLAGGGAASTGPLNVGTTLGDGTVTVDSAGASLSVAGVTTLGLSGNTGSLTFLNGSTGTLAGLNVGDSTTAGTNGQLSIQSGSAVTATGLSIGSGTGVNTGAANLSGAGSSLTILGAGTTDIGAATNAVGSLTIQSGATFSSGTGLTTVNNTGTVAISGGFPGGTYLSNGNLTINGGLLTRNSVGDFNLATGKTLTVQGGGDALFANHYTTPSSAAIAVSGAGSTFSTTGDFTVGGSTAVNVSAGGSLSASDVHLNRGAVTIDGSSSTFSATNVFVGANGDTGTLTFANSNTGTFNRIDVTESGIAGTVGILNIQGGSTVSSGSLTVADLASAQSGSVVISGSGSALTLTGGAIIGAASASTASVTVQSGGTFITSGLSAATQVTINATGALNVQAGGTLTGATNYAGAGPITLAGTFKPGTASGSFRTRSVSFAQNIALQPTSAIVMELAGTVANASHDQIVFNGPGTPHITWNGALNVVTIFGFVPQAGHSFNLFDFDAARDAGGFTSINLPVLGAGRFWRTDQLYVDGTIAVSSTPGTYAEWQSFYGTGAWDADDDGDGIKNGIEFLLGTDPKVPFGTGLYPIEELPRLGLLARVTFDIPQLPPGDAQYSVQSSPDLVTWTTIATKTGAGPWNPIAGVTVTSDPPVAGFVNTIVSETLPAATARRYHRLLGTQP